MRLKLVLIGAILFGAPSLTAAQALHSPAPMNVPVLPATAAPVTPVVKIKGDPNRIVCRDLDTTGSRVNRKRDCRTAQEWAEQNALDRQALEQRQANRGRTSD
jgi:hypothetical protein